MSIEVTDKLRQIVWVLAIVAAAGACNSADNRSGPQPGWIPWIMDTAAGVPADVQTCKATSGQMLGADPEEGIVMARKYCVSLMESGPCRAALEHKFDTAALRTCHETFCQTVQSDRPHLCQLATDRAVKLSPEDVRWQEFFTFLVARNHQWAEPMTEGYFKWRTGESKGPPGKMSTQSLVANRFAWAITRAVDQQSRLDD